MSNIAPIIIGYGGNLTGRFQSPRAACGAALYSLASRGARVVKRSPWYESAPVPLSDQPWYINGVATISTKLLPDDLLDLLLDIEVSLGRERGKPNAARVVDLDVLAYGNKINNSAVRPPLLPHPRMHERAFTVLPLRDILPDWYHPQSQKSISQLAENLPSDQQTRIVADASGIYGTEWVT